MPSNYELQTGNDWSPRLGVIFINSLKNKTQPPADEVEKARQELYYECKAKPENFDIILGCSFKNQDEVETFCNSKSDCIGYIKVLTDQISFIPLRKEPVRLPAELNTNDMKQSVYFKKAGTGSMDQNTIYIIIGVVVLLILLGLFMFLKRRSNQDYQMYQDYQQPQYYATEYPTQ